jgi:superfamily II DNA helicase RecQ
MALTATATRSTRDYIIKTLNMYHPVILSLSPMRSNLIYFVAKKTDFFPAVCASAPEIGSRRSCYG